MTFSILADPRVDARVESDLSLIRNQVQALLGSDLGALLLTGGFGRGEGSVVVSEAGVRIINDYDLAVLLAARSQWQFLRLFRKYHRPLEILAQHLAQQLQMKQVDLTLRPPSYFSGQGALKIENYEVRQGHRLLYGDSDPCALMPDWRAEDIPLFEGTWLFRNRGLGLLLAAAYLGNNDTVRAADRENFIIECTKAQLAMGDAVLLLHGQYHCSYAERARRMISLPWSEIPEGATIRRHYAAGLEQKLRPDFERFNRMHFAAWWREITDLFSHFFGYFEARRLGTDFGDWLEYDQLAKPEDRTETRVLIRAALEHGVGLLRPAVWRLSLVKARKSRNIATMALLLFARLGGSLSEAYLRRAAQLLAVPLPAADRPDWSTLTRKFLLLIHPGGEAGRVAREVLNARTGPN